MANPFLPKLAFQKKTELGEECWHSVVISLLRGLAAVAVAAAHLRAAMYPGTGTLADPSLWHQGFAFVTGFAHQAVLVFFVISGWLVGGSLLNKAGQPGALAGYAIDRVSRLWTVLVPTFVLTLLIGLAGGGLVSAGGLDFSPANPWSATVFAGNLLGLQTVLLPVFGANFPLWSLANETWYYVMFPLIVMVFGARRAAVRAACALALAALAWALPAAMLLYFSVWLLGVAFSRIRIDCGNGARLVLLGLFVGVTAYFRLTGDNGDFTASTLIQDLACSLVFAVFLSSLQFRPAPGSRMVQPLARIGKRFADFSFSLYVMHVPLIFLLQHVAASRFGLRQLTPDLPLHYAVYGAMLAFLLAVCWLGWLLFEAHTWRVRRILKQVLLGHAAAAPAAGLAPAER
ncbi:MAG: acyltransferase family protein [Telluria sp.]